MNMYQFFKVMEQIHFIFGVPAFPESLEKTIEGEIL